MNLTRWFLGLLLFLHLTFINAQGTYQELKERGNSEMMRGESENLRKTANSLLETESAEYQILGYYYLAESYRAEPAKRKKWGLKALDYSLEYSSDYGVGLASKTLGGYYLRVYKLDSAKFYYKQSIGAFERLGEDEEARDQIEKLSFNLMIIAYRRSLFDEVIDIAIPILEKIKPGEKTDFTYRLTSLLGSTYTKVMESNSLEDPTFDLEVVRQKCFEYRRKALELAYKLNADPMIAAEFNNLTLLFQITNEYDSAIHYLERALLIDLKLKNKPSELVTLNNLVVVHLKNNQIDAASKISLRALQLADSLDIAVDLAQTLNNQAEVLLAQSKFYDALEFAERALTINKKLSKKSSLVGNYASLARAYEEIGDFQSALVHWKSHQAYKDSLINEKNLKRIQEIETKYDTRRKEEQIEALTQENRIVSLINQRQVLYIILVVFLGILTAVVLIFFFQKRNTKNQLQIATHKQQLLRSQINPHFIFNALASIRGFLFEKHNLKEAVEYLGRFAKLMRLVLEHSSREWVTLKEEVDALEIYLEIQKMRFNNGFNYKLSIDPSIEMDHVKVPPLLAQPFVENAIEHGFKNIPYEGQVEFSCVSEGDLIRFSIVDNGIGIDHVAPQKEHGSKALKIFKERISILAKNLKLSLSVIIKDLGEASDASGTKIEYTLPANWKHA